MKNRLVRDSICECTWDHIWIRVRLRVRDNIESSAQGSLKNYVWGRVGNPVWDHAWIQVVERIEDNIIDNRITDEPR